VSPHALPLVAFVTAFEDFAIEAFELNAIVFGPPTSPV
jgi:DNA-binding LytR/AlgR family response regulator